MKTSVRILLILLVFNVTSCQFLHNFFIGPPPPNLDDWLGKKKSALLRDWGAPTRVNSDGNYGEILTYEQTTIDHKTDGSASYVDIYYRDIFINPDGVIYYWKQGIR